MSRRTQAFTTGINRQARRKIEVSCPVASFVPTLFPAYSMASSPFPFAVYPPTLSHLREAFLSIHPGYEFGVAVPTFAWLVELGLLAPKEGTYLNGIQFIRCNEWIRFIYDQVKFIAAEANIAVPTEGQSADQFLRLHLAERVFSDLLRNPEITAAKRFAREQHREDVARSEREQREQAERRLSLAKEWAEKTGWKFTTRMGYNQHMGEDYYRQLAYNHAMMRTRKITAFADKTHLSETEATALLGYLLPTEGYAKDTLLALKVLNRFATGQGIRVEDAVVVFREYVA
jgi:hypothetical protein